MRAIIVIAISSSIKVNPPIIDELPHFLIPFILL